MRAPSATAMLGFGAAAAGLIGIVSALTPELASRSDFVEGVLPPGAPQAARVLALALGLALIWLSRALARGKRRAWQLAAVLVVASAAAHLAKGLDFEEAGISLGLLAALWKYRRRFDAPGDPTAIRPLVQVLAGVLAVAALVLMRAYDRLPFSDRIEDALLLLAGVLAFRALYLWLRPMAEQVRQSARSRARAEQLVEEHGSDSLSFFALRRDKNYFFSPTGRSFLAYRVVGGSALVSGDPIGLPGEFAQLIGDFRESVHAQGWRMAILGASGERLGLYRSLGLRSFYLGDEAIVVPRRFSLEGRSIRKVRQSVHRLQAAGYRFRVLKVGDVDQILRAELERVSSEWRGHWPERGFTMAMDSVFAYPEGRIAVAEEADGRVGGFLYLVPCPASGALSLAAMRRSPSTPNGLMEYLIAETIEWAREQRAPELSLNFSVFAETLRADERARMTRRALRFALLRLDRFFQLERLNSFNRKFFPVWRPRYFCYECFSDFIVVALAYLRVESLLTPPGPWVRTVDLAAR